MLALPLCAIVTACATGPRPTLTDPEPIDDSAAASVIERLDRSPVGDFTAVYEITPSSTTEPTVATISQHGTELRTQIGDVVYTSDGANTTTCDVNGGACEGYANETRISNLGITHQFWGPSFRQRVATDSGRRIGTSEGAVDTIAGQPAACVAIKVPSSLDAVGTVSYCALDQGVLGRYIGADGTIELTSFALA
jgi:hypothetical protein